MFHAGAHREFDCVVRAGVAPAETGRIFGVVVLRVADHDVGAADELDHLLILQARVFETRRGSFAGQLLPLDLVSLVGSWSGM